MEDLGRFKKNWAALKNEKKKKQQITTAMPGSQN